MCSNVKSSSVKKSLITALCNSSTHKSFLSWVVEADERRWRRVVIGNPLEDAQITIRISRSGARASGIFGAGSDYARRATGSLRG